MPLRSLKGRIPRRWRRAARELIRQKRIDEIDWLHPVLTQRANIGVMLDVGAYWGDAADPFLRSGWSVWAFEPDPRNAKVLARLQRKHPDALMVDSRAVSNKDGRSQLFFSEQLTGISTLQPFHETQILSVPVETVCLDSFLRTKRIDRVDFLKVDTEGHDLFVLQGIDWKSRKPSVVMVEFEDRKTAASGYGVMDLANLLLEQGYRLIVSEWAPIEKYGGEHTWLRAYEYGAFEVPSDSWGNLIATSDPADHGLILEFAGRSP